VQIDANMQAQVYSNESFWSRDISIRVDGPGYGITLYEKLIPLGSMLHLFTHHRHARWFLLMEIIMITTIKKWTKLWYLPT